MIKVMALNDCTHFEAAMPSAYSRLSLSFFDRAVGRFLDRAFRPHLILGYFVSGMTYRDEHVFR